MAKKMKAKTISQKKVHTKKIVKKNKVTKRPLQKTAPQKSHKPTRSAKKVKKTIPKITKKSAKPAMKIKTKSSLTAKKVKAKQKKPTAKISRQSLLSRIKAKITSMRSSKKTVKITEKKSTELSKQKPIKQQEKTSQPIMQKPIPIIKSAAIHQPPKRKSYVIKTGEEYMNSEQLEHFQALLLQWKEELLRDAEITVQDMQATSANFPDPVDRASQEEEFNLELRTRDRERKLLKKIEEALLRIKENNYGYCNDCGAEIGIRRLEARPTATQCIECKTIAEIREKQVGEIGKEKEEEL